MVLEYISLFASVIIPLLLFGISRLFSHRDKTGEKIEALELRIHQLEKDKVELDGKFNLLTEILHRVEQKLDKALLDLEKKNDAA